MIKNKFDAKILSSKGKHSFFGYYDKSPWSKNGRYLVYLEVDFIDRHPRRDDIAGIILVDIKSGKRERIAETRAWNWQQGCMLQWMGKDYDSKIIFNDRKNGKFVSVIYDINTKKEKNLPFPIYAMHPNGRLALTLNFSRLNDVRRGYGYEGLKDEFGKENYSNEDGIFLIDLETAKKKLILSLDYLHDFKVLDSMSFGKHWVNHIEFNKSGTRFSFFHRWRVPGGLYYTRLISSDLDGKNIFLFPDSGFYSHIRWKNDSELFGYTMKPSPIGNVRKGNRKAAVAFKIILPIYRKIIPKSIRRNVLSMSYFLLKDKNSKMKKIDLYGGDGHSSWSPDGRFILTDTYPDSKHFRRLILFDVQKNKTIVLGKYFTLPDEKFVKVKNWDTSGLRCDLHPRWNFDGTKICFDSVHEGRRGVYYLGIENLKL